MTTENEARADLFYLDLVKAIGDATTYAKEQPSWHVVRLLLMEALPHVRCMRSLEQSTSIKAINEALDSNLDKNTGGPYDKLPRLRPRFDR